MFHTTDYCLGWKAHNLIIGLTTLIVSLNQLSNCQIVPTERNSIQLVEKF